MDGFIDNASGHDPILRQKLNQAIKISGTDEILRIILENYCDDSNFQEIIAKFNELHLENNTGISV